MDNTGFTDELFGIDVVPDGATATTHVSSTVVSPELSLTVNDATRRATIGLSSVSGRPRQLPNVRAAATIPLVDFGYGYTVATYPTIDGVTVADGQRLVLPYQSTATERGIYRRNGSVYVRDSDVVNGVGHSVFVEAGERFGGKLFVLRAANLWRALGGNDYYTAVRIVGNPIEVWDADSGIATTSGYIDTWRGLYGHTLCPLSRTQFIEPVESLGGRNAVRFNGTSDGMRTWISELRRTADFLAFHVQLVANENAATYRSICELSVDGGATTKRLEILHPATTNYIQCGGNADNNTLTVTSGWEQGTELVISAARVADSRLELFRNGVSIGSQGDTSTGQPIAATDFLLGHTGFSVNGAFFNGWIRRVAIYNVAHDDAEAVAIDAAWRGY